MKCSVCGSRTGRRQLVCAACAEPRRGARDERLLPALQIGPGRELGMDVASFEVIR